MPTPTPTATFAPVFKPPVPPAIALELAEGDWDDAEIGVIADWEVRVNAEVEFVAVEAAVETVVGTR